MRILHLLNHIEKLSGNVHAAVDLACAQAKAGHCVAVAARATGDFESLLEASDVEFIPLDIRRTFKQIFRVEWHLIKLSRAWRPDIVHAHMMTSAILGAPLCAFLRYPLITTVHNAFERGSIVMRLGHRIVAVSEKVGESLRLRGFPSKRLRVVLNGTIGSARFPLAKSSSMVLQRPAVLFVGGLHPRKGVSDLIRAFTSVCETNTAAHLYIVGEGPYGDAYQTLAEQAGLKDRISFCGRIDDPSTFMRGADIFVLCSHADPAPLVISEAREAGCAIVATCVDGIPEMLENGKAGLLVEASNPGALSDALASLLNDAEALAYWKRQSQLNLGRLELKRVVKDMDAVYADALSDIAGNNRDILRKPQAFKSYLATYSRKI